VNLIPALILSLGEELGWRGFLVPELANWVGLKKANWLSGIIWANCYLPDFIAGKYGVSGKPVLYQLLSFVQLTVTTGMILAWLRMRSGSIWPTAIFHATHHGVIQMFFNRFTVDQDKTAYFIGEFGITLIPFTLVLAWYFYCRLADV
jgi:membrane protease YdiL (CAAX protease family)